MYRSKSAVVLPCSRRMTGVGGSGLGRGRQKAAGLCAPAGLQGADALPACQPVRTLLLATYCRWPPWMASLMATDSCSFSTGLLQQGSRGGPGGGQHPVSGARQAMHSTPGHTLPLLQRRQVAVSSRPSWPANLCPQVQPAMRAWSKTSTHHSPGPPEEAVHAGCDALNAVAL